MATWRMVRAAERAGVERFVFFSALQASTRSRARFFRAKALAERAVAESSLQHTIFAPSIVYSPGDPWLRLLERMSLLPVMPIAGPGRAAFQPIWAEDVADCVVAALDGKDDAPASATSSPARTRSPTTASSSSCCGRSDAVARSSTCPLPIVRASLRAVEALFGQAAFATWDEAELMEVPMTARSGTADAERLGVVPKPMRAVLGVA